jgi:hypothetical protein
MKEQFDASQDLVRIGEFSDTVPLGRVYRLVLARHIVNELIQPINEKKEHQLVRRPL